MTCPGGPHDPGPINFDTKVKKFGEAIKVDSKTLKVKNKPININIDLSLTLGADEMVAALGASPGKTRRYKVEYMTRASDDKPWLKAGG